MQDPYPATFQRRHHNISLGAVFFCLHVNNNLSNRFKVEIITDLNQITKTGWYSGGNITQINQYMSGGWNIINAAVQPDDSARISVFNKQGLVLEVNRDGSSSYTYFPLALKSDLSSFLDVSTTEYTVTLSAKQSTITSASATIKSGYTPLPGMLSVRTTGTTAVRLTGDNYYTDGKIYVYMDNEDTAEQTIKVSVSMLCYKS